MSVLEKQYQDEIVTPFLQDLEEKSSKSLKSVLTELRSRKGNCRVHIAARRCEVQKGERGEG